MSKEDYLNTLKSLFSEYDPVENFENPQQRAKLLKKDGTLIQGSEELFAYGKEAFEILSEAPEIENFETVSESINEISDSFNQIFAIFEGKITFNNGKNSNVSAMNFYNDCDWIELLYTVCKMTEADYLLAPGLIDKHILAIAVLYEINHLLPSFLESWDIDDDEYQMVYKEQFSGIVYFLEVARRLKAYEALYVTHRSKLGAKARHEENYSIKKEALNYYNAHRNKFKSMSQAAEFISTNVVPMKYRTVYEWIRKDKKTK